MCRGCTEEIENVYSDFILNPICSYLQPRLSGSLPPELSNYRRRADEVKCLLPIPLSSPTSLRSKIILRRSSTLQWVRSINSIPPRLVDLPLSPDRLNPLTTGWPIFHIFFSIIRALRLHLSRYRRQSFTHVTPCRRRRRYDSQTHLLSLSLLLGKRGSVPSVSLSVICDIHRRRSGWNLGGELLTGCTRV